MPYPVASIRQQSGKSGQFMGCHRQNEAGSHPFDGAIDCLRRAADRCGPAEGFFDPLSALDW